MNKTTVLEQIEHYKNEKKPVIVIGLDTHKDFSLAYAEEIGVTGEIVSKRLSYKTSDVIKFIQSLKKKFGEEALVVVGYESGPTGKGLCRELTEAGYICQIIPASRPAAYRENRRIKTDRRDARAIMVCLVQQDFIPVYVTSQKDEETKQYIRMRDDFCDSFKRCKQQINAFILQSGKRYKGKKGSKIKWTEEHLAWLRSLKLGETARQTLNEYLAQYDFLAAKIKECDRHIKSLGRSRRYKKRVQLLRTFPGVDYLIALSFICEIGDFSRFETAGRFAAFIGLVPGENSSGLHRSRTGITKTGNRHLRRLAVLAAQALVRSRKVKSGYLLKKQKESSPDLIAYADRCQRRLLNKFYHLVFHLNKQRNVAVTAVARELCCFFWGAMTGKIN